MALCAAVLGTGTAAATTGGPVVSEFGTGLTSGVSLWGITAGPDGNLWFTEESHNAVGRITPVPSSRSSPPASRPAAPAGSSRARTATSGSPWRAATARSRA
jgi:virginiamycin B lyase